MRHFGRFCSTCRRAWSIGMGAVVVSLLSFAAAGDDIRHSLLILGPSFTGVLDEEGEPIWDAGRPAARDGFVLPNENRLIAWSDEVQELTPDHQIVFRYRCSSENQEIATAQRLSGDRTLVVELGSRPRLLEVDSMGKLLLAVELQPETDNAHMQTRMARRLPAGNYLVPHLLAFCVKEYEPSGHVVKAFRTDLESLGGRGGENWPFTAIRLPDKHTLVTLTHGNKVVEFDDAGHVTWQVSNDDFPTERPFADPCGAQRLANGNTVIASYGATGPIKVFEVTRDKRLVWKYAGPHRAHEIQILTTNGRAVEQPPLK